MRGALALLVSLAACGGGEREPATEREPAPEQAVEDRAAVDRAPSDPPRSIPEASAEDHWRVPLRGGANLPFVADGMVVHAGPRGVYAREGDGGIRWQHERPVPREPGIHYRRRQGALLVRQGRGAHRLTLESGHAEAVPLEAAAWDAIVTEGEGEQCRARLRDPNTGEIWGPALPASSTEAACETAVQVLGRSDSREAKVLVLTQGEEALWTLDGERVTSREALGGAPRVVEGEPLLVQGGGATRAFDPNGAERWRRAHECGSSRWARHTPHGVLVHACDRTLLLGDAGEVLWERAASADAHVVTTEEIGVALHPRAGDQVVTLGAGGEEQATARFDAPAGVVTTRDGLLVRPVGQDLLERRTREGELTWAWRVPESATVSALGHGVVVTTERQEPERAEHRVLDERQGRLLGSVRGRFVGAPRPDVLVFAAPGTLGAVAVPDP